MPRCDRCLLDRPILLNVLQNPAVEADMCVGCVTELHIAYLEEERRKNPTPHEPTVLPMSVDPWRG